LPFRFLTGIVLDVLPPAAANGAGSDNPPLVQNPSLENSSLDNSSLDNSSSGNSSEFRPPWRIVDSALPASAAAR
jgi:hypothetical protein